MNDEIKRILRLSTIPGFKLLDWEEKMLEDWKAKQEEIKVEKPTKKAKTEEANEADQESGIGSNGKITVKNIVEKKTK